MAYSWAVVVRDECFNHEFWTCDTYADAVATATRMGLTRDDVVCVPHRRRTSGRRPSRRPAR